MACEGKLAVIRRRLNMLPLLPRAVFLLHRIGTETLLNHITKLV